MKIEDGIAMLGRFSVGWNFHSTRRIRTFGLAISFAPDRWLATVGPITFVWLT